MSELGEFLRARRHPDPERLLTALEAMFESFAGSEIDPVRYSAYVRNLADLDVDALERACEHAQRESRFLPSVAELRERARAFQPQLQPDAPSKRTPKALAELVSATMKGTVWTAGKSCESGACEQCGAPWELAASIVALLRKQRAAVLCGTCINVRLRGETLH